MTSANSRFLGKTYEHRAGHEQANSGSGAICSKFLFFALPSSASWRGVPQGLSQDFRTPRIRTLRGKLRSRRREGVGEGRRCRPGARSLPARREPAFPLPPPTPHSPRRAASAPPCRAPPQESRGRRSGRSGRSSSRQVPQGHAFPGGCKPQAKVEKGWSFPSNPFYTVKTAKLSPSRPLFNWEANRRKTKTSARADFPCVFPSQRKARSLVKRKTAPRSFAPFEVWTGGAPSARGSLDWALSPPSSPNSWVSTRISSLHGSCRSHTSRASSILRFLARADVGAGVLGAPRALNYPQTQVPPTPGAGGGGLWASSPGARRPQADPKKHLPTRFESRSFPWGKAEVGGYTARRQTKLSTCRETCRGGVQPPGEAPEKQESRGRGTGETARVRWAESQDSGCPLITLMC